MFAFFLFARISNLVPDTRVQTIVIIVLEGVMLNHLIMVCVLSSYGPRLISFEARVLELPLISIPDSPLCPVCLFCLMCELVPAPGHSPSFVYLSYSGVLKPVLKCQFISVLHAHFKAAKVPQYHLFRGHSFRQGGTSWAFSARLPGELIQVFSDWCSDAYKSYLDISMDLKVRVAKGMVCSLGSSSST